jgi:hypothetical protein
VLSVSHLSYLVDPLHCASDTCAPAGCYAPPLVPGFR